MITFAALFNIYVMESFLEILKYTIPALIVFATAYYLLKLYLDEMQSYNRHVLRQESNKITLPVRLQAYERLILLCDRVGVINTLFRIRMPGMTVSELRGALLMSISQEFDHNTSQQLYVSDVLWQIITLAKNQTLSFITNAADDLDPKADADLFVQALLQNVETQDFNTLLQKAAIAIRTEAGQLF